MTFRNFINFGSFFSSEVPSRIPVLITDIDARSSFNDLWSSPSQGFRERSPRSFLSSISASPLVEPDSTFSGSEQQRWNDRDRFKPTQEPSVSSTSRLPVTPSPQSQYSSCSGNTVMSYEDNLKKYNEKMEKAKKYWKKREQKSWRKDQRNGKRLEKTIKKTLLRQDIQSYIDAGVAIDDDDREILSRMRHLRLLKSPENPTARNVSFNDDTFPGGSSARKSSSRIQIKFDRAPPPPPTGAPPKHLVQPIPKNLSQDNLAKLALRFKDLPMDSLGFKVFSAFPTH